MNGTASAAEWLACGGIGIGFGALVLGLMKVALDSEEVTLPDPERLPAVPKPPALPTRAPQTRRRHAAPPALAETQPLRTQTYQPRHAKEAA
ncbi:hypothetical protein [Streptomyces coerulescens]|uniref:Secreted protein n=1 Tax=Streptomyces coerulescens TaxID=29304 RepID=A0ABW0CNZ9_STRCD